MWRISERLGREPLIVIDGACSVPDGTGTAGHPAGCRRRYNHDTTYVDTVLTLVLSFQQDPSTSGTAVRRLVCHQPHRHTF